METLSGLEPPCPGCTKISNDKKAGGKRVTAIGRLRPDIVLFDETSLTTHGVKLLVKDFAKTIHEERAGKVVFVNRTEPAKS